MNTCFLFGHAKCPDTIMPKLADVVEYCYSVLGVRCFYVGNRGHFDSLATTVLKRIKQQHNDVCLYLLLAYHPAERPVYLPEGFDGSYYPPLENIPRPYAIVRSNQYMVTHTDCMICYVKYPGNARKLLDYAKKKEGTYIENLAELV